MSERVSRSPVDHLMRVITTVMLPRLASNKKELAPMSGNETEIIVEDPHAPDADSPAVISSRNMELIVSVILFALAILLGWDNWRTGIAWDSTGPQAGYFPFYLSVILGGAALYGFVAVLRSRESGREAFVTRAQLRRVAQVFVPTFLFCLATQFLGLYVASFLLITGFMRFIGRISWMATLLTASLFIVIMFVTFDVAFNVIMPKGPLESMLGR